MRHELPSPSLLRSELARFRSGSVCRPPRGARDKPALTAKLRRLIGGPGFTGAAPGGPSRWSTERSAAWEPLKPKLVVEVSYDHFDGGRFRHGTTLLRWRPDKAPSQCTMDQIAQKKADLTKLLHD